jgi:Tfp pilus assembly protein PilF
MRGIFDPIRGIWLAPASPGFRVIALRTVNRRGYSERDPVMSLRLAVCLVLLAVASPAALQADARSDARNHVEFGIHVAQRGLWREAIFQWQRAIETDPTYAEAYNNLAIGFEHEGEFAKARDAYEKALQLDPDNAQIRQNYELFKEINDRTSNSAKETP